MKEFQAEVLFDAKGRQRVTSMVARNKRCIGSTSRTVVFTVDWRRWRHECVSLPAPVSVVVPGPPLLVTSGSRLLRFDWKTRKSQQVASIALDSARVRFNGGQIDPTDRPWLGTRAIDEQDPIAALYRLTGRTLKQVLTDVKISNGLVWRDRMTAAFPPPRLRMRVLRS